MTGKKKKGYGKKKGELSEAEVARRAKAEAAKALKKKLELEQQRLNEFQQQRKKLKYFWTVEKKNLEDKKAEVREKSEQRQDLEEKSDVEIKTYKSLVKHSMFEFQNELTSHKTDCDNRVRLEENESRKNDSLLKKDQRFLKQEGKEKELSQQDFIKALKQEQDRKVTELRQGFERKARDLQLKFDKKARVLRERLELQRRAHIQKIEKRKDAHVDELMRSHEKSFAEVKNYYNDITHNNLDLIKSLKEEVAEMKKKEAADEKLMSEIAQENKRMSEPLKQALKDVDKLRLDLKDYSKIKEKLADRKAELAVVKESVEALKWENEVLDQRLEILRKEKEDLHEKLNSTVLEVKEKTGFKNLLLEKKVDLMDKEMERADAYTAEILKKARMKPKQLEKVQEKVENLMRSKDEAVVDLTNAVADAVRQHNTMLQAYESKLAEYGIPVEEIGLQLTPIKIPKI